MVLAIEPGCYFIDYLLDAAQRDARLNHFLVPSQLSRFRRFGGVRLEDEASSSSNKLGTLLYFFVSNRW